MHIISSRNGKSCVVIGHVSQVDMMCQYLGGGRLQLPQEGPFLAVEVQGIDGQELFALGQQGIRRQLFPLPPDAFPGALRGDVRNSNKR